MLKWNKDRASATYVVLEISTLLCTTIKGGPATFCTTGKMRKDPTVNILLKFRFLKKCCIDFVCYLPINREKSIIFAIKGHTIYGEKDLIGKRRKGAKQR